MSKRILRVLIILSILTACTVGALYFFHTEGRVQTASISPTPAAIEPAPSPSATPEPTPSPTPEPTPTPKPRDITLMAVGDNLMHMGVVYTGKQEDGSLDYSFLFRKIEDFLGKADIKIINQETILGGNHLGFSGFPYFNSPTETGDSIAAAGFNVVLHASNHSADQGIAGIEHCISFWKQHPEVAVAGLHEDAAYDTAEDIPILTIDGTTFAILNYTYGPNMEVIPSDIRGRLDILCKYNEDSGALSFTELNPKVEEDIRIADKLADVVIVCPHWGTEYVTTPSVYQTKFAMQMVEAGADLIIGTHPHVVEPVEWIEAENGNQALCFYSLGNYVSTQKQPICMLEAMAWVTFERDESGVSISREKSGAVPLVCHYTSGPVRIENIYLLEDYTEEQAAAHGIRSYGDAPLTLSDLLQWQAEILGDSVLSAEDVLNDAPPDEAS